MSILIGFLTVIEVIVCLLLILIILMQRPRQEGLGAAFGGGVTDQMFGAQTTNVLQKFTGYLAGALFLLTLVLAVLTTRVQREKAAAGKKLFDAPPPATAPAIPAAPAPTSTATAPVAVPSNGATDGKTISVTKQPGATVVVKQPEAKPASPPAEKKPDAKSAPKPAAAAPAPKPQAAATPSAPKDSTPPAGGTQPAAAPKPAASSTPTPSAPVPSKP